MSMFDASVYVNRRNFLKQNVDSGLILILGNEESPMNFPGNTYHFRQDSNFLYFFGLDKPHLAGIIDVDEDTETLLGNEPSIDDIVWMGPQAGLAELAAGAGLTRTASYEEISSILQEAATAGRPIHYLPPYRAERKIKLSQWLNIPIDELQPSETLIKAVVEQAIHKSPEEIAEIEKAVNISGAMHLAAMRAAKAGMKEKELRGIAEGIAVACGGHLAYQVILTVNGQTLHNQYHGNTLASGRLVLGDFGAETEMHYAGDITRTFPVDPSFTDVQKEVYGIVLASQLAAMEALQPETPYLDVHLLACRKIADGLKAMKLMKGNMEDAVREGAHALFFPHGLGHMMGLDVHDMEDLGEDYVGYAEDQARSDQFGLKSLRLARKLESSFVLTVEPGIYFIPQLIDHWQSEKKFKDFINYKNLEKFRDFGGIRIEDNVLITDEGYRLLGNPIPKTVEEVEGVRKG